MTTTGLNVPCPVCGVDAGRTCVALDYLPLPTPHVERTETTPLHDAVLDDLITTAWIKELSAR